MKNPCVISGKFLMGKLWKADDVEAEGRLRASSLKCSSLSLRAVKWRENEKTVGLNSEMTSHSASPHLSFTICKRGMKGNANRT